MDMSLRLEKRERRIKESSDRETIEKLECANQGTVMVIYCSKYRLYRIALCGVRKW